jgi:hypothetical protein
MKEYLIVRCTPLDDQFECDAERIPLCIVTDYSQYGFGYEVWERKEDNSLEKIKDYDISSEEGFALYSWEENESTDAQPQIKYKKIDWVRFDITKSFVKKLKREVGFCETVDDIYDDIIYNGAHGETIQDRWVVFGEYMDAHFSLGY